MKKNITHILYVFALAGMLCPSISLKAQEVKEKPNIDAYQYLIPKRRKADRFDHGKPVEHLFFSLSGGVTYLIDNGMGQMDAFGPRGSFQVGNWFTPVAGARIGVDYGMWKRDGKEIHLAGVSADYLVNLSAFAARYDEKRFFELVAAIGIGYQATIEKDQKTVHSYGLRGGLQGKFNVSPAFNLFVEPQLSVYPDRVDNAFAWRRVDLAAAVMVGLTYKPAGFSESRLLRNGFVSISTGVGNANDVLLNTEMSLGKWFDKVSGIRISAGSSTSFASNLEEGSGREFDISLNADYLCDLTNLFSMVRKERVFQLVFVAGVGSYFPGGTSDKAVVIDGRFGLQGGIRLSGHSSIYLEPRLNVCKDKTYRHDLQEPLKASPGLMIGTVYRF